MQEVDNILRILKETKLALQEEDSHKLRDLSNQTNNTASRTQDPDNIAIAVIIYSMSKIIERDQYRKLKGWKKFYKQFLKKLDLIILDINKKNSRELKKNIQELRESIDNLSGRLKEFIQDVFRKASINKASKIYEHGISMEKTSKLLGISLWELANYSGAKADTLTEELKTIKTKDRIKFAEGVFS
ncbi:MAG: hypothetical protein ACOCUU_00120 [Nanoarchaeota archaeon]